MGDIIRVFRMIEYVGPRDAVEQQINNSIHGEKIIEKTGVKITTTTLGTFPEILNKEWGAKK